MNHFTYNVGLGFGLACITAGCWLQWGAGVALIAAGALTIALTLAGAALANGE